METIPISCHKCNTPFDVQKKEYTRQFKKGRNYFFCSSSCAQSYNKKTTRSILSNCLWCRKLFWTTTHKRAKKYCSRPCIQEYARTHLDRKKLSDSIKRVWDTGRYGQRILTPRVYDFICVVCGQPFQRITKKKISPIKTCNDTCRRLLWQQLSQKNPNCGGDTNYRKYKYNDIWMDSKWEVKLAQWMDENGIKWDRSRKRHMFWWTDATHTKRRYYPDFYLPDLDVYADPKNKYLIRVDTPKINAVIAENGIRLAWGLLENVKKEIDILRGV